MGIIRKGYNRFLSKDKKFVSKVRPVIGFTPDNVRIFRIVFAHRSNGLKKINGYQNNERLEYLGDSILSTIVAEYLFKKYPSSDEGFLTKMRSKIVKRKTLNHIGYKMGLDVLLIENNKTHLSQSMMGNALEALIGAIYLERGYKRTKKYVIHKVLMNFLDIHELELKDDNYKSQLLEHCQKMGKEVNFKLLNKYKQDKRDRFKIAILIDGEEMSIADDFNKKSAEQQASAMTLRGLGLISNQ